MTGTTSAGTFRHLGTDYRIERRPEAKRPWVVVELATGKTWHYATFQPAFQRRKAQIAGVSVKQARGLPA